MKGKYNMNTKGKIDFTKTDNIQFIEKVAIHRRRACKGYRRSGKKAPDRVRAGSVKD